jgi:hypothetical protein
MKEYLLSLLSNTPDPLQARNQAREYLQALILQSLQRAGAMVPLAFHGGMALRFLYNIQRYSEDLNFALEGNAETYEFRAYFESIRHDLETQGYTVILTRRQFRALSSVFRDCPSIWDFPPIQMKDWPSSLKWIPAHHRVPAWKLHWCAAMCCSTFSITTGLPCWPGNCTPCCKDLT